MSDVYFLMKYTVGHLLFNNNKYEEIPISIDDGFLCCSALGTDY